MQGATYLCILDSGWRVCFGKAFRDARSLRVAGTKPRTLGRGNKSTDFLNLNRNETKEGSARNGEATNNDCLRRAIDHQKPTWNGSGTRIEFREMRRSTTQMGQHDRQAPYLLGAPTVLGSNASQHPNSLDRVELLDHSGRIPRN